MSEATSYEPEQAPELDEDVIYGHRCIICGKGVKVFPQDIPDTATVTRGYVHFGCRS